MLTRDTTICTIWELQSADRTAHFVEFHILGTFDSKLVCVCRLRDLPLKFQNAEQNSQIAQ